MIQDIRDQFSNQFSRLKSIFRKPQPEDNQVVNLEEGDHIEILDETVADPKLKSSKTEVKIPKLQIGKKILKQSTNLGLGRQNTNRST